jgi:hypothetical protein
MRQKEDKKLRQGVKFLARSLRHSSVPISPIVTVFVNTLNAVYKQVPILIALRGCGYV